MGDFICHLRRMLPYETLPDLVRTHPNSHYELAKLIGDQGGPASDGLRIELASENTIIDACT